MSLISARRARDQDSASAPSGTTDATYGAPQAAQHAPSFSGAPHEGQQVSSTSPHSTHLGPPFGEAISRTGRNITRPSTANGTFDGQLQFGQNPCICEWCTGGADCPPLSSSSFTPSIPAIFSTVESASFEGSPFSNIETALCMQPAAFASALCVMPFERRASAMRRQQSMEYLDTACIIL